MVVCGCNHKETIDFNEVFSPIICYTFIVALPAFVALFYLELKQLNVKTTFPYGELNEEIYEVTRGIYCS